MLLVLFSLLNIGIMVVVFYVLYRVFFSRLQNRSQSLSFRAFGVYLALLLLAVPFALIVDGDEAEPMKEAEPGMLDTVREDVMALIEAGDREGLITDHRTETLTLSASDWPDGISVTENLDGINQIHLVRDTDPAYGDDITVTFVYPHSEFNERVVTETLPQVGLEEADDGIRLNFSDQELVFSFITPMITVEQFSDGEEGDHPFMSTSFNSSQSQPIVWIQSAEWLPVDGYFSETTRIERQEEE